MPPNPFPIIKAPIYYTGLFQAKVAREKLDGIIPEGTGFEMERRLDELIPSAAATTATTKKMATTTDYNRIYTILYHTIL